MALNKDRVRFYLKKPGKGRARYSVLRDVIKPDGRRVQELVQDERIDAVNRAYKSKLRDTTSCELELAEIIRQLYLPHTEAPPTFTEENRRLLEKYWEAEYADRSIVDPDSARNDLLRAIAAVGTLSLVTATKEQLQRAVDRALKGNKQRRVVSTLNQLLKFTKRPLKLRRVPKEKRRVRFLSPAEFAKVVAAEPDFNNQQLMKACFATGGRVGEVFAINVEDIRAGVARIDKQLKRDLTTTARKRGGECLAVVHPDYAKDVLAWASREDKESLRLRSWPKIVRAACERVFPDEPSKWVSTHGLRHSYAIWLLSKGVSLSLVAQSLGDSDAVVQEYYAGFVLAPDSIATIKRLIG
jgi:integrase